MNRARKTVTGGKTSSKNVAGLIRLSVLIAFFWVSVSPSGAATITIVNLDGPGEGFNDPTAATPLGGNTGTTVGQQRLIAFQAGANIWAGRISSPVTIRVRAQLIR